MAGVLAVLEQRGGVVKRISHEALTAARSLADSVGGTVDALVMGPADTDLNGLGEFGPDRILSCLDDELALYQSDRYAQIAAQHATAGDYTAIVLGATALGRDLGPRIGARLGCPFASDVTSMATDDGIVVTRPAFSGKAIYKLKVTTTPCVISIRPNAVSPQPAPREATVTEVAFGDGPARARTVRVKEPEQGSVDVSEASIVVSGGRGLREPENFRLIEELAHALGAAIGASRAAVDAGWRPHAEQVGQTGKTVSPNLYFAIGISGAIQHLAGMRTAKIIVAINKDRDAPIFKVADYGIVGDLFEVVPKLTEAIKQIRES